MGRALAAAGAALLLLAAAAPASAEPFVAVEGDAVGEGDTPAEFLVWLSEPSSGSVIVHYATRDGSAVESADYSHTAGQVEIPPGDLGAVVPVPVHDDALDEPNEDFTLELVSATGATVDEGSSTASATILDDDPEPSVWIGDAATASSLMSFPLRLSGQSAATVTVDAATADGSLRAGQDYQAASRTLSFPPGSVTAFFNVFASRLAPSGGTVHVDLSNPRGLSISRARATGTVVRAAPTRPTGAPRRPWGVTAFGARVREGRTGAVRVVLSSRVPLPVVVRYAMEPVTALPGVHYVARAGSVTIPGGELAARIPVRTLHRSWRDANRTLRVRLRPRSGAVLSAMPRVTILDDPPPRLGRLRLLPGRLVRFTLSERATMRFRVQRRVGRRWRRVAVVRRRVRPGVNRVRFSARALAPGLYRLVAVAVDRPGGRSRVRRVAFRIPG